MSDDKNTQINAKTILITLDKIDQTIDIMTNVVDRLRGYVAEQSIESDSQDQHRLSTEERNSSLTLH